MASVLIWIAMALAPVLVLGTTLRVIDRYSLAAPRSSDSRSSRRRTTPARRVLVLRRNVAAPAGRPIQVVAADLRRLSRELAVVPSGAPLVRWRALWAAYDRVLVEAAVLLEVPHELTDLPMGSAREIERLRLACTLEAAGLQVHD
jgi:hypothetical protein